MTERGLETTIDAGTTTSGSGEGDLLLVAGPGHLITHALAKPEVVIGRAPECDVVIDHRALSRRHAQLRVKPLAVQDLGSTNGTRVGSSVLTGGDFVGLRTGESFHIGPFSFMVIASQASQHSESSDRDKLVVEDPTAAGVSELVRTIAKSGTSVLIQGETGVGKDVLAHTIHELSGRTGPLCRINCAALSDRKSTRLNSSHT